MLSVLLVTLSFPQRGNALHRFLANVCRFFGVSQGDSIIENGELKIDSVATLN